MFQTNEDEGFFFYQIFWEILALESKLYSYVVVESGELRVESWEDRANQSNTANYFNQSR